MKKEFMVILHKKKMRDERIRKGIG